MEEQITENNISINIINQEAVKTRKKYKKNLDLSNFTPRFSERLQKKANSSENKEHIQNDNSEKLLPIIENKDLEKKKNQN